MDSDILATVLIILWFLGLPALAGAYHLARILVGRDNNNTVLSVLVSLLLAVPVGAAGVLWIAYQLTLTLIFLPPALLVSYFGGRDGPKDAVLAAAWWATDMFYNILHHGAARGDAGASQTQTSNGAAIRLAPPPRTPVEREPNRSEVDRPCPAVAIRIQVEPPPYSREDSRFDDPPPKYENIEPGRERS
ncbi:hypothetical protein PG985_013779 [Apiospora marii]|uniref:Uncharacterized protein n=1 Tax=Apiospora marii TaxID=335849 RepID=A0ABR1R6T4_9PEZI